MLRVPIPIPITLLGTGFHSPPGIKRDSSFSFNFSLLLPYLYPYVAESADSKKCESSGCSARLPCEDTELCIPSCSSA